MLRSSLNESKHIQFMQQLVVLLIVTHAVRVVFGLQLAPLDLLLLQQQMALVISVHNKRLNLALQLLL